MPSQFCLTHQCLQSQCHCRAVLLFCYIGTSSVHLLWHRVKLLQSTSQLGSNGSVVPSWLTHSRTHRIPYGRTPLYTKTAHCKKNDGKTKYPLSDTAWNMLKMHIIHRHDKSNLWNLSISMKMKIVGKRMFSPPNIRVFGVSNIPISILIVAAARQHRVSPLQITERRHFRVSFFVFKKLCNAAKMEVWFLKKKWFPPKSSTFFSHKKCWASIHGTPHVFCQKLSRFHQLPRHQIQETQVEIRPSPVTQRSCLGQSLVELGKEWDGWDTTLYQLVELGMVGMVMICG